LATKPSHPAPPARPGTDPLCPGCRPTGLGGGRAGPEGKATSLSRPDALLGVQSGDSAEVTVSNQPLRTSYDEVPYPSVPFPQTHPDRPATVATLLGLNPVPADRCRVLELGCASGGNLIPLAYGLPDSTFLGIDLSSEQIAQGQKTVQALGLQ